MKIVAPVMRFLGTADVQRSAAFYRDTLGFEIRELDGATEAWSGEARLRFGSHDFEPLSWDDPQEPGSAMVFFEVDDLDAARAAIEARGGRPGAIAKINRVKMRVFELPDPDGHVLWFGQSYDEPDQARKGMIETIMPGMPAADVARAVDHYREVLGFTVNYQQADLAVMDRDQVRLLVVQRTPKSGVSSAYVYVKDADSLHAELAAKGARIDRPLQSHPWGLRDFRVLDLDGNEIEFGQPFE
jgi:catechol 2,3-dioxygenase-like lactoylglutathione lyase family enzyme